MERQELQTGTAEMASGGRGRSLLASLWYYRLLFRLLAMFALGMSCLAGAWLTFKQSGDLGLELPQAWVRWYNTSGQLRNIPAYLMLGILAFAAFPHRFRNWVLGLLFAQAALFEIAQLWIPSRLFDPLDIICSWAGLYLAYWCLHLLRAASLRAHEY